MLETSSQRFFTDFASYQPNQIAVGNHRNREDQSKKPYVRRICTPSPAILTVCVVKIRVIRVVATSKIAAK